MPATRLADRVLQTTEITGQGTYSLGPPISTAFLSFLTGGAVSGDSVAYICVDDLSTPTQFEIGEGVITAGVPETLTRSRVIRSSNGGAAVAWGPGTKYIFCFPYADQFQLRNSVQLKTAAYAVTPADHGALIDFTVGSAFNCTLPLAANVGDKFFCDVRNHGAGRLTFAMSGSDTLDGTTGIGLGTGASCRLWSTGTSWRTTFRSGHRGALVYRASDDGIANNTITLWSCGAELYDTDNIHSTSSNVSRLTVPAGVTKVRLSAYIEWAANATGLRYADIRKNGSYTTGLPKFQSSGSNSPVWTMSSAIIAVSSGDYFEVNLHQTSGGALAIVGGATGSWFAMEIIE